MFGESSTSERPRTGLSESFSIKLLAALCAVAVTAVLFVGYTLLRKRHAERTAAMNTLPVENTSDTPKGPAKVHVLVDDPMLKAGDTLIGGTIRNISSEDLDAISVELEFRRRKDGAVEAKSIDVVPTKLGPGEEGRYEAKFKAQNYGAVRLIGIRQNDLNLIAYTSGQGLKRPLEKTESKTIIIQKPGSGSRHEEFINTPDNPGRVP